MASHSVARANLIVFAVLVSVVLLVGGTIWERVSALHSARTWLDHSYTVIDTIDRLDLGIRDAETGQRGYLLTGDADLPRRPIELALGRVGPSCEGELQRLTADESGTQSRTQMRDLAPVVQHKLEELAQTDRASKRHRQCLPAALRIVRTNVGRRPHARQVESDAVAAMTADEQDRCWPGTLADERAARQPGSAGWRRSALPPIAIGGLLFCGRPDCSTPPGPARPPHRGRAAAPRLSGCKHRRWTASARASRCSVPDGRADQLERQCFKGLVLRASPDTAMRSGTSVRRARRARHGAGRHVR